MSKSKEKKVRQQYIITYDIENSKIYEVWYYYEYRNMYVKCPIYQSYLTEYMKCETNYITNEYKERAEKIIEWSNNKHNTHYQLLGFTHKYLANIYMLDCTTNNITSTFTYEPFTDDLQFDKLINMWLADCDILFTAHNLDYEYNYIRYNTKLLHKLSLRCKCYKIIAESTSNIKSLEFISETGSKFIIRDTYLISNKSIRNLGKSYDLPKLEYDYEVTRLFRYDINDNDLAYNMRDNEIAMKFLQEIKETLPIYKDITKIPLSATQHSKNICRYNKDVNYKMDGKKYDLYTLHRLLSKKYNIQDFDIYRNFFNASGGGLIGVNPIYTNTWQTNVHSFDIKSAHPSQMYNKNFPVGESIREVTNYDWIMKKYKQYAEMMKNDPKDFYNRFLPEYDYLVLIEFRDLTAKILPNNNIILSLGSGKQSQNYNENELTERMAYNYEAITINGKTKQSKVYRKWVFGIDLIYHLTFYDFNEETTKIIKAYKYKMDNCSPYIISKADYYGAYKEKYKNFTKYAEKNNFKDTMQYVIDNNAEEYTIKNMNENNYNSFLDTELLRIKGIFNGLFGQEYQNILHDDLQFDYENVFAVKKIDHEETNNDIKANNNDEFEITNNYEYNKKKYKEICEKSNIHYTTGAYIAGWSRFELACMIWHCINNGGTIYYFHTDSLKCGNCKNDIFNNWYDKNIQYAKWNDHNVFNFGLVDYEKTYDYFITPETLKDIGILHDKRDKTKIKIDITLSGIKADIYFKDILNKYNYKELKEGEKDDFEKYKIYNDENIKNLIAEINEKIKPQIVPGNLTGKLARQTKYSGVKSELGQVNFGVLEPIEYNFLNYRSEEND